MFVRHLVKLQTVASVSRNFHFNISSNGNIIITLLAALLQYYC